MRMAWPLLLLAGCSGQAAIAPGRIVSNNPCIDAVLAEIADPASIGAVSAWSHDPSSASASVAWASRFPGIGASAEEVVAARPRLLLSGNIPAAGMDAALKRARIPKMQFGVPATLDESAAQVRAIGRAIGREAEGAALARRIEAAIKPLPFRGGVGGGAAGPGARRQAVPEIDKPHPNPSPEGEGRRLTAIIWQSGGFVPGKGTIQDEMLDRAGFTNASDTFGLRQWDPLPLETLLRNPPDLIFTPVGGEGEEGRALAVREHALARLGPRTRIVPFPERLLFCGGPSVIEAMRIFRAARP